MADSYFKRVFSRAWRETKEFWSSYRWWVTTSSPIVGVLFLLARSGWGEIMNAGDVLINAAGGAAVAFLGTWIISLVRSPKLLNAGAQATIETKTGQIAVLEERLTPKVSSLEQSRREIVAQKIGEINEQFRELAKSVLRLLIQHGEMHQLSLYADRTFRGPNQNLVQAATGQAQICNLLRIENGYVSVNPELREALAFCLLVDPPQTL